MGPVSLIIIGIGFIEFIFWYGFVIMFELLCFFSLLMFFIEGL